MAQLKSTTISDNLVVTGNINCKGDYWADGSINGNGWFNGYNIKTINDCTEAIYKYGLTTLPPYPSHRNLNYTFAPGIYNVDRSSWSNMPFNFGYGTVFVFYGYAQRNGTVDNYSWIYQFFISTDINNKDLYVRKNINYTETGWGPWLKIA